METGVLLVVTLDCHSLVKVISMKPVWLSEWTSVTETMVIHLVYIAVMLRPLQSIVVTALTSLLEKQSMWDCMPLEVGVIIALCLQKHKYVFNLVVHVYNNIVKKIHMSMCPIFLSMFVITIIVLLISSFSSQALSPYQVM